MDLETLAGVLKDQASKQGKITFDQSFLTQAQLAALQEGFGLGTGSFTIAGVSAGDIPAPASGQLRLSTGTVDALAQKALKPAVVFTVDVQGTVQFVIDLALPAAWGFKDSFPNLAAFPFDQSTPSASHAVYATTPSTAYAPWPDQPGEQVPLAAGLNLACWLVLDCFGGALALLEQVVNGTDKYKFCGPVRLREGVPYPVMDLASPLTAQSFRITDGLDVGGLALGMSVSAPAGRIQDFALSLTASTSNGLQFGVSVPSESLLLSFYAQPQPGHTFGINQILSLPGGKPFQQYIPQSLSKAFDAAALQSFVLTKGADNGIGVLGFVIGSNPGYSWTLIDKVLVLEGLRLEMNSFLPGTSNAFTEVSMAARAKIFPTVFTGDFEFQLTLDNGGARGWEVETISGRYLGQVRLSDLVRGIVGNTARLPDVLSDITFSNFGAVATKQDNGYSYTIYGQAGVAMPMLDTTVISTLNVTAAYSPAGYGVTLNGSFLVGSQNFELELDLGNSAAKADTATSIVMRASWKPVDDSGRIGFADLARAFGFSGSDVPAVPKDLDLALKEADFYYDFTNKQLLVGLQSATYGSAVFSAVVNPDTKKWQFFFGLNVDKPIPISNLPLIGDILPPEDTVQIRQIRVVIASAAFGDTLATQVNTIIGKLGSDYPAVPDNDKKGMDAGLGFSMKVSVGSFDIPIMFGAGQQQALGMEEQAPRALLLAAPRADAPVSAARSSDGVLWFNLQKTFGPVSIQKIGVQYKNERIFVLVNMQLSGAGLTIGVVGLGIGSKISSFDPAFTISGIDVTYAADGVVISGGLLGSLDPLNFVGELMIKAEDFGIAGLAGYTSVESHPSMFLYAVLNAPLGGPPYFFVTGLAGGFGFNRDLQVPDASGIADFPLVQWARGDSNPPGMNMGGDIGSQVNQVLERLADGGVVAPRVGEYWLAAGIKFTSFKLINSFALAMAKFGAELEIDLVGVTSLTVPPVAPVVFAEMQLLASFKPAQGLIGIAGQLTPRSYVLSPDCHLTGGFAYYFWFAGPNEGNFVMTMGGYNPRFSVPDYYPKVPRIGINWKVTDSLVIKGEEYFAVTSAAVMAGGGLSASWSGGGVTAWFNVQADFLMVYQPFHYYLDASVDIGASFRINLLFTHVTLSIHIGADLEIWGPDFTGEATVDLDIISFTISFGASGQQTGTRIAWEDFVAKMLPGHGSDSKALRAGDAGDTGGIKLDVSAGLVRQLGGDGGALDFVVSPELVELTISTAIPIKESHASFGGVVRLADAGDQPKDQHGNMIVPNEAFGVGPAGIDSSAFTPSLEVSITLANDPGSHPQPTMECVRVFSNAPNALWQKLQFDRHGTPILGDPVNDATLANVITGYKVVPVRVAPHHSLPINIEYLKYTVDPNVGHFAWSGASVASADDFAGQTVEDTITAKTAVDNRAALLPAIHAYLAEIATSVSLQGMADPTHAALMSEPVLRLLGEQRAQAVTGGAAVAEQAGALL